MRIYLLLPCGCLFFMRTVINQEAQNVDRHGPKSWGEVLLTENLSLFRPKIIKIRSYCNIKTNFSWVALYTKSSKLSIADTSTLNIRNSKLSYLTFFKNVYMKEVPNMVLSHSNFPHLLSRVQHFPVFNGERWSFFISIEVF